MTSANPISAVREGIAFTRVTSAIVLTTFLSLILSPTAAAARESLKSPGVLTSKATVTPADHLNDTLKQVKATFDRLLSKKGLPSADDLAALARLKADLVKDDAVVMADFDQDLEHIKKHKLPAVIEQRHADAVADYKARQQQMLGYLDALGSLKDPTAIGQKLKEANDWLAGQQLEPAPAPFDPNKLGFQVETKKARAPKLSAKELRALFPKAPLKTSSNAPAAPLEVATIGSMAGLIAVSAVTPPGPEYLAPTIDVQITPEIQALATALHHNPVEIYNWVHNNVEWIPTYGSVQGSALTLDKKAGNAFDTSSLLLALLRASGIPARYVYGTIQVPIAQAMNWAGGFTSPDAAQTFLATGGIPNNALTSGGVTKYIQMEHIWVEAFVDFYPSRGAKNFVPDTWVPMDASYKQYAYAEGLDLQAGVPFDAQGFLTSAQQGATVNEQEGWVQNLNQANIQSKLTAYQQQLQSFIESQNPGATVGQVLGAKTIQASNAPVLAASLPYKLVATGNRYSALPDSLRHKFQYSLYANAYERSIENPLWTYQKATPSLAGKKVTLSFVPASDADRQTIESYLPKPHSDGSPIQPEEFPSSLPAYNIRVTAELRVEGNVVARGGTFTLGTELLGEGGFTRLYNLSDWDLTQEQHVAGQSSAIGISLQGITGRQLNDLKNKLEATSAVATGSGSLTGQTFGAEVLTATIWGYFAATESFGRLAQRRSSMVDVPALSYGFFHTRVSPITSYGVVSRVAFPGALMDVGHQRRVAFAKSGDLNTWIRYNRARGQQSSSLEALSSEHAFNSSSDPGRGLSTSVALAVAATQGQRLYKITEANQGQLENIQASASVLGNVRAALASGKEVTIHQRQLAEPDFSGTGYSIVDPQTGSGSYLIEGGAHGGQIGSKLAAMMGQLSLSGDNNNYLMEILSFIKDVLVAILDKTIVAVVDLILTLSVDALKLKGECNKLYFYTFLTLDAVLLAIPFAVGVLFPIWFAFIIGFLVSKVVDAIVENELKLCPGP